MRQVAIVLEERGIELCERIGVVRPVHRQDNHSIRVRAVLPDILYPTYDALPPACEVRARLGSLLLKNDMCPSLGAHEHTCRRRASGSQAFAFLIMVIEGLAEISVGSPRGIFLHGLGDPVEHIVLPLVLIVDKRVVH